MMIWILVTIGFYQKYVQVLPLQSKREKAPQHSDITLSATKASIHFRMLL